MAIEVDPKKDARNKGKHGIALTRFEEMDFETALSAVDEAHSTPDETRWTFVGWIEGRLFTGIVTYRGMQTRVISLRPASRKERKLYAET